MKTQPRSSRCHKSSSGVGSAASITSRDTPARADVHSRSRRHAADNVGDHA